MKCILEKEQCSPMLVSEEFIRRRFLRLLAESYGSIPPWELDRLAAYAVSLPVDVVSGMMVRFASTLSGHTRRECLLRQPYASLPRRPKNWGFVPLVWKLTKVGKPGVHLLVWYSATM